MQTKGGEDLGISDIIAGFIQQELDQAGGALELQRADLAQRFNCVPSQINYVMSTRFSPEHGYFVESRRRAVEAAADTSASRGCRWTARRC